MKRIIIAAIAFSATTLTYGQTKTSEAAPVPAETSAIQNAAPAQAADAASPKEDRKPVKIEDLPTPVRSALTETQYKGWSPSYAYWVADANSSWYEITLVQGTEKKMVKYNAEGSKLD